MCDDITDRELDAHLKRRAITRRGFALGASATLAAGGLVLSGCAMPLPWNLPTSRLSRQLPLFAWPHRVKKLCNPNN